MNGNIDSLVASMDKLSSSESSPISNQSANDLLIQDETIEKYSTNNNNHKDNIGQDSINDLIKIDPKNRMTTTTTTTNIDSSIGHHPNHNQIIRHHHQHRRQIHHHRRLLVKIYPIVMMIVTVMILSKIRNRIII